MIIIMIINVFLVATAIYQFQYTISYFTEVIFKSDQKLPRFIENLLKSRSVLEQRTNKWKRDLVLKRNSRNHKVCMKTSAEIHGFTLYAFNEASKRLKNFEIGDPFAKLNDTEILRPLGKFEHDI